MSKQTSDLLQGALGSVTSKPSRWVDARYGVGQRIMLMARTCCEWRKIALSGTLPRRGAWLDQSEWGISETTARPLLQAHRRGPQAAWSREENWRRFVVAIGKVMQTA